MPDFLNLVEVNKIFSGSEIIIGAQDCFWEKQGAFTGEISPFHLKEAGCEYVLIGHSERRENIGETNTMLHAKIRAALEAKLIPVLCVGEKFEERQQGQKDYILLKQVTEALEGVEINEQSMVVIAYEPRWVIGSGQAVEADEAEHAHRVIFQALINLFDVPQVKKSFRIIYGGSVNKDNAQGFLGQSTVNGVLVGTTSLNQDEFINIIEIASKYGD